jgi:non-reducing end alpha-L-arabinofuranosidase
MGFRCRSQRSNLRLTVLGLLAASACKSPMTLHPHDAGSDVGSGTNPGGQAGGSIPSTGLGGSSGTGSSAGGSSGCGTLATDSDAEVAVPPFTGIPLPCEVMAKDPGGAKCVAAHSTVRVIVPGYAGPLYQLCRNGSGSGPGACRGEMQDIGAQDGYADVESHEAFCGSESCTIAKVYDQSGWGNDLEPAPQGGAKTTPDSPCKANALPVRIKDHNAYGILIKSGMGYRSGCDGCTVKKGKGMALGDAPQSLYMVTSQRDLIDGCCFDYGNGETTSNADGNGAIEAVYFGGGVVWGSGAGSKPGPWVMADFENGLYAGWERGQDKGISTNRPLKFDFVTAVLLGDTVEKNGCKGRFALYGADASGADATYGGIATMYDGIRPERPGYAPMNKQGSLILGTSGDNSSGGGGRFYEGAVAAGPVISKSTVAYLQAAIVAAKYQSP